MLDPTRFGPGEADQDLGQIVNEAGFYHELLHGQVVIDAMHNDADWQRNVCGCNPPPTLEETPEEHPRIFQWEQTFTQNLAAKAGVRVVRPQPEAADRQGRFEVNLGPPGIDPRGGWGWKTLSPGWGNIRCRSIAVKINEQGDLIVRGSLANRQEPGFILLRVVTKKP